jgi:hypothetical protein
MSELMTTTYSMWRLFRNCRIKTEHGDRSLALD